MVNKQGLSKVAVVIGATSKWQADGSNTKHAHERVLSVDDMPMGIRWGVGGAIAQKFASEGYFVVLTTRLRKNASDLQAAIEQQGGKCMIVELDVGDTESVSGAFRTVRETVGDPEVVVYNAGSMLGRDLPAELELLENLPVEIFDAVHHIAARGPFLVAKEALPAMRRAGAGTFLFTNNPMSLRGRKRNTGESLYYPRVMARALSQVLTEEYSRYGVHIATVIIDGYIDSPGTRALVNYKGSKPMPSANRPGVLLDPMKIAETYYYLHMQDRSCWTHEIQLTPFDQLPAN